ncbi:MAG TPA: hypothetical protein VGT99_02585 [Gammaproteobacteria bacterium]|nr:hypothetical protein [Gammaproteobacteria bacterium]
MHARKTLVLGLITALGIGFAACASSPPATSQVEVKNLQGQLGDLSRQLGMLQRAPPADQQAIMGGYWDMLKKQLQYARNLPGVESHSCKDWMLVDPMIAGSEPARAIRPCPTIHDSGPVLGWELPPNLTPHLFGLMMQQQLGTISAQVDAITAEADPAKRTDLYRRLYETRYQDIQTVLGRDWMWTPQDASTLPDAKSLGAELLVSYCSQCHNAPSPGLHTQAEWMGITRKMHDIIDAQSHAQVGGIRMPSPDEFNLIVSYLEFHAHGAQ